MRINFSDRQQFERLEDMAIDGQLDYSDFPPEEYTYFSKLARLGYLNRHKGLDYYICIAQQKELREDYLSDVRAATLGNGLDYITTAILAIGDNLPNDELAAKLAACAADEALNKRLPRDWPGMDTGSYMEYILARLADSPRITECRQSNVHDARWDPSTRKLTIDYTPGKDARITVTSGTRTIDLPTSPAGSRRTETLSL